MNKKNKFITAGAVVLVALAALALGFGSQFSSDSDSDAKQVFLGESLKTV